MLEQQPTRLTIDGIIQLINKSTFQGQSFVLQTLTHTDNYLGHHYTQLSDGYCRVQCQLVSEAKQLVKSQKLKDNDIIRFTTNDCEVISDSPNPYIILSKCQVTKTQLNKSIGGPMPYKLYKEKNYTNPQASNLIQTGPRTYSIRQVINNTRIKNGHIRAIVTKLPNNTSRGLCIFNLKDSQGTQIQAVCFEQAADLFLKQLKLNEQYIFSGFILNKNKKTNQDQLKFKKQAQITKIIKTQSGETFRKPSQSHEQPFSNQLQITTQQDQTITKKKLMELVRDDQVQNKFFTIVGKVTYLNVKNMFRKINVQDKNNDVIDLVLWEEVKDVVLMEKIYKFTDLRVKYKPDMKDSKYIELQSSKKTTISILDPIEFQAMSIQPKPVQQHRSKPYNPTVSYPQQQTYRQQRTKKLPEGSRIISIQQLIEIGQNQGIEQNGVPVYPLCECTIKFRTEGLRFRDESDILNYFSFFCKPCFKTGTVTLTDNEKISCNRCKKDDVQIKWNLRIRVMDFYRELPCSIQSQATERFLNLDPKEGYLLFMQSKQQFQKLLHRVNFDNRVCKFQIKTQGVNKFFNILQIYAKDSRMQLNKHMVEFRKMQAQYKKLEEKEQEKIEEVKMNEQVMAE